VDIDRRRLLIKIARLYYEENLTQAEISVRLRMSRQKVQRILGQSRDEGIVQIAISPITGIFSELERAVEARFGVTEALVVEAAAYDNQVAIAREVGAGAAEYLKRITRPGDKIVMSWGNSLLGMVNGLTSSTRLEVSGMSVIQGLGGLGDLNHEIHATQLVRRTASALNAQAVLLPAPAVAASPAARDAFYKDPYVAQVLNRARAADIAFVGIGSCSAESISVPEFWRAMTSATLRDLVHRGAVGSINLRYFDAAGKRIPSELDKAVIGLTLEELKKIPHVVGVAGGSAKLKPIRAALEAKLINVLVTDHVTAQELLKGAISANGRGSVAADASSRGNPATRAARTRKPSEVIKRESAHLAASPRQ
jgi:DNA-binding transcriptional regulator LsrR (DeoR family)